MACTDQLDPFLFSANETTMASYSLIQFSFTFTLSYFTFSNTAVLYLICGTNVGIPRGSILAIDQSDESLYAGNVDMVSKAVSDASSSSPQHMSDSLTFMYISTPYRCLSSSVMNTLSSSSSSGPSFKGVSFSGE